MTRPSFSVSSDTTLVRLQHLRALALSGLCSLLFGCSGTPPSTCNGNSVDGGSDSCATGGVTSTGGASTGGTISTGGTVTTGGSVSTGGTAATGGTIATGGTAVTGGAATGGSSATGGSRIIIRLPTGGAASTGGAATGGAATGGAQSVTGQTLFITSTTVSPNLGGVSGADAQCQQFAAAAGLDGTWKAVLSDATTTAQNHVSVTSAVYTTTGALIAANAAVFWSGTTATAPKTEKAGDPADTIAWVGSTTDNCLNWSTAANSSSGTQAVSTNLTAWLLGSSNGPCNLTRSLYCINSGGPVCTAGEQEGTSCGTGAVCHSGTCELGCWIGSRFYASGAANPDGLCQSCQPTASTTTWTSDGTVCGCTGSLEVVQSSTGLCVAKMAPITAPTAANSYNIDATEVTKGQYDLWLGTSPALPASTDANCGYVTTYAEQASGGTLHTGTDAAHHPVADVDWCDAYAYCQGVGKRLCGAIGGGSVDLSAGYDDATQSQWYRVCSSGGADTYPYGNTYQETYCDGFSSWQTVAVGSLANCVTSTSGYAGAYDLSGNVFEWEDSCNGTGESAGCLGRGGSFGFYGGNMLTCDGYRYLFRNEVLDVVGFRCCSSP